MPKFYDNAFAVLAVLVFGLAVTLAVFTGGAMASIGIVGSLLALALAWVANRKFPRPRNDLTIFVWSFLVVCAGSVSYAYAPETAWKEALRLATIALPLLFLSSPDVIKKFDRPWLFKMMAIASSIAAMALAVELMLDLPLLRAVKGIVAQKEEYNRGASNLVMLAIPIIAALTLRHEGQSHRRKQVIIYTSSLLPLLIATASRATQLSVLIAVMVFIAARYAPRFVAWGLGILVVACAFWPLYVQYAVNNYYESLKGLPRSWRARMDIWDYLSHRIMEQPWFGWGIGNTHKLPFESPHKGDYLIGIPGSHAHNLFVQAWVELGVPGMILAVAFSLLTLIWVCRQPVFLRPFSLAAWAAGFSLVLSAYDPWNDALLSMFGIVGLTFALLKERINQYPNN